MTQTPHPLWQSARDVVARLWRAFVSPAAIAVQGVLSKGEHVLLRRCLCSIEALLRSLLLIDAVALVAAGDVPKSKPEAKPRRCAARQKNEHKSDGVRFRLFTSESRGRGRRRHPLSLDFEIETFDAWPLAARGEAIMRVLDNPEAYTRCLARKLSVNRRLIERIGTVEATHFRFPKAEIWEATRFAFYAAAQRLADTS